MATTEPHKIPPTIISRCQRFEFRKISVNDIVERLSTVVNNEGTQVEDEALQIVARAAEGGMRDALSLIDQAISYSDETVTTEDVLAVTGSVSQQYLGNLVECIRENDVSRALRIIDEMMGKGKIQFALWRISFTIIVICFYIKLHHNWNICWNE